MLTERETKSLSGPGKPGFFYGYVIVIACFFMMVVWWGSFYAFGVFFEPLLAEFGWSRAATASAYSLQGVLMGLFAMPIAGLCYKFGPRLVIGVCGLLGGLGFVLMSQINALWQMYLLYGVLMAINLGAYLSILPVVTRWFVRRRGLMTGVVFSGLGVGMVVVPPLVTQLIAIYGWRLSYVIVGVVATVGVVTGAQFLKPDPYRVGLLPYGVDKAEPSGSLSAVGGFTLGRALRTSQFWLVGALYFIYLVCHTVIVVHIVIYAIGLGVPAINAARILSVLGVLLIVGLNVIGMAADRIGNKSGFAISFVLLTVSFVLLIATNDIRMLYVFAAISGFAFGGMQVLFSPMVAELFGLSSHGVILGATGFIAGIGSAFGPAMAGYIFDVTESYYLAFIICVIMAAIAVILALLLRPLIRSEGGGTNEP